MLTLDLGAQPETWASGFTHTRSAHMRNGYRAHTDFTCMYAHTHVHRLIHQVRGGCLHSAERLGWGRGCSSPAGRGSPSPRCDTPPPGGPWDTWECSSRSQCHGTASQRNPPHSPASSPTTSPLQALPAQPTLPSAAQRLPSTALQPLPSLFLGRMCPLLAYLTASTRTGAAISSVRLHRACGTSCPYSPPHHSPSRFKLFCAFPHLTSR